MRLLQTWRGDVPAVAVAALACVAFLPPSHAQPSVVVIRAGAMIDVERALMIERATIVVDGKRIAAAGSAAGIQVPAGATVIDLPSTTLLPGLIDGHVHLTLGGDPAANARATLAAGFTTVQDLGAAAYANVALRDAIKAGRLEGPRVIASGPWLGVSGGTCDFNDTGVRGAEAFRQRVREDVRRGADLIKVCVTGWLADAVADQAKYEITDDELTAAIDEAHKLGRRVAVHAIGEAGVSSPCGVARTLWCTPGFPRQKPCA
jgi:imidazolonepropionase-like amidohydrolase